MKEEVARETEHRITTERRNVDVKGKQFRTGRESTNLFRRQSVKGLKYIQSDR